MILQSGQGSARWLFCSTWCLQGLRAEAGFFARRAASSAGTQRPLSLCAAQCGHPHSMRGSGWLHIFHNGWLPRRQWEMPVISQASPRTNINDLHCIPLARETTRPADSGWGRPHLCEEKQEHLGKKRMAGSDLGDYVSQRRCPLWKEERRIHILVVVNPHLRDIFSIDFF